MNLRSSISKLTTILSRVVRGLLLVLWIGILVSIALGSLNGSIADLLLSGSMGNRFDPFGISIFEERIRYLGVGRQENPSKKSCPSGSALFSRSYRFKENPPPIDAVLDLVMPTWASAVTTSDGLCNEDEVQRLAKDYEYLRNKVADRLHSLARDELTDPKTQVVDETILPPKFRELVKAPAVSPTKLPPEVQDWIVGERKRQKKDSQAHALVGTFLLLSTLGAFGALIFLIRDYTSAPEEKRLSVYIFRPILGIFLAVAVFVVDILAHSIISTASILEIRYEPLYLLALGAGLLSERAYEAIRGRADSALERYQEEGADMRETSEREESPRESA